MRLLIIRHGESEADIMDVHEGRADFPLTERGQRQALAMAKRVARDYAVNRIYASTLKRAYETACFLAGETGLPVIADERLMEFDNGLIAGLDRKTAQEKYPFVPNVPLHGAVYGQESALQFRFRADTMLSVVLSENGADDTVAVVTHGGMINQLYRAFLRLPVDSDVFFGTGDTGLHEWAITEGSRRIVRSNDCCHAAGI